jgi:transposase-like protein
VRRARKHYSPDERVVILRRHLIDRLPISDLCDEYRQQPCLFPAWQRRFRENGSAAFERKNRNVCSRTRGPSPRFSRRSSARTRSSLN